MSGTVDFTCPSLALKILHGHVSKSWRKGEVHLEALQERRAVLRCAMRHAHRDALTS